MSHYRHLCIEEREKPYLRSGQRAKLLATWSLEQLAFMPYVLRMPIWRTICLWIYEKYLMNGNSKVPRH